MSEDIEYKIYVKDGMLYFEINRDEEIIYIDKISLIGNEEKEITKILKEEYITDSGQDMINKLREITRIMKIKDTLYWYWLGMIYGINLIIGREVEI